MRSHTVPRAYLVGFAEKDGLVVVNPRSPDEALRAQNLTPIDDVSIRPDYYAVRRSTGLDYGPENALDLMEKRIFYLRKGLRPGPLSDKDLGEWTRLAGAQHFRGRNRSVLAKLISEMMDEARADAVARGVDVDEAVRAYVRENIYDGDAEHDPDNLALLGGIDVIKITLDWFKRMYQCVLTSRSDEFITSDEPVAFYDPVAASGRVKSVNLAESPDCEVTYPLDRRHCLVMAYRRIVPQGEADEETVETINARTALLAKEVYVPPCDVRGQAAVLRALQNKPAILRSLVARHACG
jgi:hypothetical protein